MVAGAWPEMTDFVVYWEAGRHFLNGEPIYTGTGMPFVYPPIAAALFAPLALLPLGIAEAVWLAGVLGTLALTVAVTTGIRDPWRLAALTGAMCCLGPVLDLVHFGQVGMLLVALCVVDCLRPGRFQGVLVGLATGIKLLPALFVIWLWATGRRRSALTAAATFAATVLLLPGESWTYWTERAFDTRERSPLGASNVSLYGLVARLPVPAVACWLLVLAVVAVLWWTAVRRGGDPAGVAVTGMVSVLVSPVAWPHYLVWVVAVIGVLVRERRTAAAAAVWVVFLPWDLPAAALAAAALLALWAVAAPVRQTPVAV